MDGQTDGWSDSFLIARRRLHSMQHGKNGTTRDAQKLMAEVTCHHPTSHMHCPPTTVMCSHLRNETPPMWRMLQLNDTKAKCEDVKCKLTHSRCSHATILIER